ncbi:hypothetical protein GOBAR_AA13770 [Gossypium barbadense]|uniref:Uncharacterized protein n=1 Tax=Gossypium barbadense TaxID=3634 RepID=A0A2P5XU40_GOSBA|nr:hypothetical protein GOBAR_AA13770 [Gossypium barbadense]
MVRDVGLAMRCGDADKSAPLHELDERVVATESVGPRAMGGHHQECPRRPPLRQIGQDDIGGGDGGRTDALERLGLYEAVLGAKHQTLGRIAGGLIRLGEIEPCRDHRILSLLSEDETLRIVLF